MNKVEGKTLVYTQALMFLQVQNQECYRHTDTLLEIEPETLGNTVANEITKALIDAPADPLAEVEIKTLGETLADLKAEAQLHALVDTVAEVEAEKLYETLMDIKANTLLECMTR